MIMGLQQSLGRNALLRQEEHFRLLASFVKKRVFFCHFFKTLKRWLPLTFCRKSTRMGMRAALSCSRVKRERGVRTNSFVCPNATSSWKPCCLMMASTASLSDAIRWFGQVYSHVILYLNIRIKGNCEWGDFGRVIIDDEEHLNSIKFWTRLWSFNLWFFPESTSGKVN